MSDQIVTCPNCSENIPLTDVLTKKIRKFADTLEKHAGMELLLDQTGSTLITVYRKY